MPRVHTAKAAKDYPEHGIKKGDEYYHWAFFRGPKQMSKTRPRPSQTTGSSNLAAAYAVQEALEDAVFGSTTPEDVADALRTASTDMDECISNYEETVSNLEQGFPNGCPALEEANERKDACETFRDDCDGAAGEVDNLDADQYRDGADGLTWDDLDDDEKEAFLNEAQALADITLDC